MKFWPRNDPDPELENDECKRLIMSVMQGAEIIRNNNFTINNSTNSVLHTVEQCTKNKFNSIQLDSYMWIDLWFTSALQAMHVVNIQFSHYQRRRLQQLEMQQNA